MNCREIEKILSSLKADSRGNIRGKSYVIDQIHSLHLREIEAHEQALQPKGKTKESAVDYLVKEFSEILGPIVTQPMQDLLMVDAIQKAKAMEEYAQSHANEDGWTDEKVSKLLKMQIEECAVFAQRCGRDKGMASIEYDQWIKETPILDLTPQTNNNEDD